MGMNEGANNYSGNPRNKDFGRTKEPTVIRLNNVCNRLI